MPKAGDPLFEHLEHQMEELMGQMVRRSGSGYRRTWAPRVDVYETADEFVVLVDIAGVSPEDVGVEVDEDEVTICGTRRLPQARTGTGSRPLQLEVPFGQFERRLRLPVRVDADRSTASVDAGLLTVRFPKMPRSRKRVEVEGQ
ncbi:MAG TPA: Hsp20/alpha crystallin family protein [Actinomycetota bacterium]|nr:Hsp20/alpha crystallin family protein [Actinomycetota bacterium]